MEKPDFFAAVELAEMVLDGEEFDRFRTMIKQYEAARGLGVSYTYRYELRSMLSLVDRRLKLLNEHFEEHKKEIGSPTIFS